MRWYQLEFFIKMEGYPVCQFHCFYTRAKTNATAMFRARCFLFRFRKEEEKAVRCGRTKPGHKLLIELTRIAAFYGKHSATHVYLGEKYTNIPR